MSFCEAAGFDIVIVETVGVGQSEIAVADLTDHSTALYNAETINHGNTWQVVVDPAEDVGAGECFELLHDATSNSTAPVASVNGSVGATP